MYDTIIANSLEVAFLIDEGFDQGIDSHLRSLTGIGADDPLDLSA